MNLINDVDRPGSDIEQYVGTLDKFLADKVDKINNLRGKLQKFNVLLKDEEALSSKFMNSADILDLYDQNKKKNYDQLNDDDLLNEDISNFNPHS